ncbi:uncharacterized protein DUF1566 [Desulfobotulus alkaliphilus]|uniref:Uncharacterized protein DUF1566 n=1 Tax=Desulfobotulus alkaliphilus TaxID=622671 RepID=A0A562RVF0_9BACT|nr:DUF1566 domain-containing protein [Desulfobotulus alkaliphilus]TWI73049.1 uncharacterized protein DUF1566 [Desulfobotulus alkaliphilus]
MNTTSNPKLSTLLQQINNLKTEFLPLPEHAASACDTHTKERYLTLLASLAMADNAISEAESRLISLLRASMGLEVRNSALYEQAGNLDEEGLKDFFRAIKEADIAKSFILDALILCRLDGPLNPEAAEVLGHLTELMALGEEDLKVLVGLSCHVLGIENDTLIPFKWNTDFYRHWHPVLLGGKEKLTLKNIDLASSSPLKNFPNLTATVVDEKTGLEWMRCSMGQTWDGSTCVGDAKIYNLDEAMAAVEELNKKGGYCGHKDWRLPTIEELNTLVYCSSGKREPFKKTGYGEIYGGSCKGEYQKPTINLVAFPNTPSSWFWSSSPYANYGGSGWALSFDCGYVVPGKENGGICQLRLVRAGQ